MTDALTADTPHASLGPLRPPTELPSHRAIWHWATQAAIGWMFVIAWPIAASYILDHPPAWLYTIMTAEAIAAVLHVSVMPWWRYRVHRWEVSDEAAYTRVGWISYHYHIVPASRIQTVDIHRHALQRMFGLATVSVSTAHGGLMIDGLRLTDADQVADTLKSIIQATPGDAT
jgi:membrane protein YdbS with pleckstrin-like domain